MTSTTPAYRAQRARSMAYGTWRPWAEDPAPVREHVRQLRECGASYEAIGRVAGVATMAVHSLLNGGGRLRAETAEALLGVTPQRLELARLPAAGAQRRIRGLVAMGHSYSRIARAVGVHFETVQRLARGDVATAPAGLQGDVSRLYEAWWDKRPPERTKGERMAAEASRRRAEREGWPTGAGLDDARIDDPSYVPQASWRRAEGTGTAADDPLGRERQRWAEGPDAGPGQARETQMEAGEDPAGKGTTLDTEYDVDGNAAESADYDADAAQYEHDAGSWLARDGDGQVVEVDADGHPGREASPDDGRPVAEAEEPAGWQAEAESAAWGGREPYHSYEEWAAEGQQAEAEAGA